MTALSGNRQFAVLLLTLASLQLPVPTFSQEKKDAPKPPPEGLKSVLARTTDENDGFGRLAVSPDGTQVAVVQVAQSDKIGIWNIQTGKKHPATFPVNNLKGMAFTPDGKTLLIVDEGRGLVGWEVETGKRLHTYSPSAQKQLVSHSRNGLALSPSADVVACSVNGTPRFWGLKDGKELTERRIVPPKDFLFTALAYSPDGNLLFGGTQCLGSTKGGESSPGADVRVWACDSLRPIMTLARRWGKFEELEITRCQASADGRFLACSARRYLPRDERDADRPIFRDMDSREFTRVWDLASGQVLVETEGGGFNGDGMALSPDGRLLAVLEYARKQGKRDIKFTLWDLLSQEAVMRVADESQRPRYVAFAAGGESFVAVHGSGKESVLGVWDVPKLPVAKPSEPCSRYWEELGDSGDPKAARRAIWNLLATPKETIALLREHHKPIPALDRDKVKGLIADLNDNQFATRDKAMKQLEELSWHAAGQLEAALGNPASAAQKKLLEDLLKRLDPPYTSADRLRRLRANEVLERLGTPDAVKVLEEIAKGAPKAPETEDANSSLKRLAKKARPAPAP